jgi:enoyl-CoA hydratase/carnithine racemase
MAVLYDSGGVTVAREDGPILVLALDRGQNLMNEESVALLGQALRVVEDAPHPKSLVITGVGKFFSNGFEIGAFEGKQTVMAAEYPFMVAFWRILARLLTLDCHAVCAINGHAFGAGLFLALACDWRVMRTHQGFVCFPELNLGMSLLPPFAELAKAKLSAPTLREGVLTGCRYDSAAALKAGIIDEECPSADLMAVALRTARRVLPTALKAKGFSPEAFARMKRELYPAAHDALATYPVVPIGPPPSRL